MAKKTKKPKEMLVVGSKVKAAIKEAGKMTAGEFLPALNEKVHCMVAAAVERATGNKRSTVRARDV